jgi:glycosyltransferase involved in cell wall biosynthesis
MVGSLTANHPSIRGVMVGTGPLEREIRRLIAAYGLSERLTLLEDQYATRRMAAADICVMTSVYEGMSYVVLEAQALGIPVVAFEVAGLRMMVEHGVSGLCIPQENEIGLHEGVTLLCNNEELRHTMGIAATARAQRFGLDAMINLTESLYLRLLEGARHRAVSRFVAPTQPSSDIEAWPRTMTRGDE